MSIFLRQWKVVVQSNSKRTTINLIHCIFIFNYLHFINNSSMCWRSPAKGPTIRQRQLGLERWRVELEPKFKDPTYIFYRLERVPNKLLMYSSIRGFYQSIKKLIFQLEKSATDGCPQLIVMGHPRVFYIIKTQKSLPDKNKYNTCVCVHFFLI